MLGPLHIASGVSFDIFLEHSIHTSLPSTSLEPFHGTSQIAIQYVIGGLVCPLRARTDPYREVLAPEKVKPGQASLRPVRNCSFRADCKLGASFRSRYPEAP